MSLIDELKRQVRIVEQLVQARLEIDVPGLVAGVRARLGAQLALTELPVSAELADRQGPLGWGRVRTTAWQAPGLRKIALTHVALPPLVEQLRPLFDVLPPIVEGFALVLLPEPTRQAPAFGCDLMALPTRVAVHADVYGAPERRTERRQILEPLGESFVRLGTGGGPEWARELGSGVGLHAKLSPRKVEDAFGALSAALARYLELVADAPTGESRAEEQSLFFRGFHLHGPRRGPIGYLFGQDWAERYSRLLFE